MKSILGMVCVAVLSGCGMQSGVDSADVSDAPREGDKPEILTVGPWLASEQVAAEIEAASQAGDVRLLEGWGPRFGRGRGALDQTFCPSVAGVTGRSGIFVDAVQLLCTNGDGGAFDQRWLATEFGGLTGARYNLTCPNDYVVTGIQGAAGDFVDRLGVRCTNRQGQLWTSAVAGGSGGPPYTFDCPPNEKITGFNVWHGSYIDALQPFCGRR